VILVLQAGGFDLLAKKIDRQVRVIISNHNFPRTGKHAVGGSQNGP